MRDSAPAMKKAIDTQFALNDLRRSGTIQPVTRHKALHSVNIHKDFNRFFHYVSSFGLAGLFGAFRRVLPPFRTAFFRLEQKFGYDSVSNKDFPLNWIAIFLLSCGPRVTTNAPGSTLEDAGSYAEVLQLDQVTGLQCENENCTVATQSGVHQLDLKTSGLSEPQAPPDDDHPTASYPLDSSPNPLPEQWNDQIANTWRSPFRAQVPSPDGGSLRLVRGLSSHTSRIMRVGGKVVVARQAPPPDQILYPRVMALHPTGQEAYLIVWPNPDLIAFQPNSLETNWRIRLDGPAIGLFVSENGRYLVAELDGIAPEEQLLDYEDFPVDVPSGVDPISDEAIASLPRPLGKNTAVIDLAEGKTVARLPGPYVGFHLTKKGAVVASKYGVSILVAPKPDN